MTLSSSSASRSTPVSPLAGSSSTLKPNPTGTSTSHLINDSNVKEPFYKEWLLIPKLLYFFLNMIIYSTHSFGPQYFVKELLLKDYQVSFISAFTGINFLGAIFWSSLADRTGHHKLILALCSIGYAAIFCLIQIQVFTSFGQETLKLAYTAVIVTVSNFIQSSLFPLLDANVIATMASNPKFTKENFGRQRLFGSIGHTAATLLAGLLLDIFSYKGMFFLLIGSSIIFSVLVFIGVGGKVEPGTTGHGHHGHGASSGSREINPLKVGLKEILPNSPTPSPPDIHHQMHDTSPTITSPIWTLMTDLNFMFFMLFVLIAGIGRSVMTNYQAYFILNTLDKGTNETAWTTTVRLVFEIGVFFFGKQLMHIVGIYWLLILSQVAGIARLAGYAMLNPDNPYAYHITFGFESIKGLNSGLMSLSAIKIASDLAPKGCENSAQGLFSGNFSGLSMAAGGLIGGLFLWIQNENAADKMQVMFWWSALATGFFTFLFTLIYGVQGNLRLPKSSSSSREKEKRKEGKN